MGRKKLRPVSWSSCQYFACPFVSHEDVREFYCLLCNLNISGRKALENHVGSLKHEINVDYYGRHISPLEDDYYMCDVCDCIIPYYTNVHRHITAKRHRNAMYRLDERKEEPIARNSPKSEATELNDCNNNDLQARSSADGVSADTSAQQEAAIGNISYTHDSYVEEIPSIPTSTPSGKTVAPERVANLSTIKTYSQRFVDLLDFQRDIYDMGDRVREMRLGMELCLETESGRIYCLVCRVIVVSALSNYAEHLCSLDHVESLEELLKNGTESAGFVGNFSDFDLSDQYMERASDAAVNCLVCSTKLLNVDRAIESHTATQAHREKREEMRVTTRRAFEAASLRLCCDWYKIQKYCCVPCSAKFDCEMTFAEHFESEKHGETLRDLRNCEHALTYDFCAMCALLWYGYRGTYASHCEGALHRWYTRNAGFVANELPESARHFLAKWGVQNEDAVDYIDYVCALEEKNNKTLVEDLGNRVKLIFPCAKVCAFGSRISLHCTIDVFLGCDKMNDGRTLTEDQILYFMTSVNNWLGDDPHCWEMKSLLTGGRSPVINANHRATGLSFDVTFDNGLVIGGIKIIESFDVIFPSCCKLMHYISQWLANCELTGTQHIPSYALYWYLIFYLQRESVLPSVAALTSQTEAQAVDGNQVDETNSFAQNYDCKTSLKDLIIGFFKFYANFDFRHDVACPLIGDVVKKRSFAYPEELPVEMGFYVTYVKYSSSRDEFPIDSPMCIQDPFNLNHNISKTVSKVDLSNFRTYCRKTADFFCSS